MVVYFDVKEVKCELKEDRWSCELVRLLSDNLYKTTDNKLCFNLKTETINNLEDVHLLEGTPMKCTYNEEFNSLRCEKK